MPFTGSTAIRGGITGTTLESTPICFTEGNRALLEGWIGPLSRRLAIDPSGRASVVRILVDRVLHARQPPGAWANLRPRVLEAVEAVRFPMAAGKTFVILPIMLGGPLAT